MSITVYNLHYISVACVNHSTFLIFFLMIRRPPRSTRTDTSFPTRRSSDLDELPRDRIEDIVIGIGRAETRLGLEISDALDRLPARQISARHEHQDRKSTRLNSSH